MVGVEGRRSSGVSIVVRVGWVVGRRRVERRPEVVDGVRAPGPPARREGRHPARVAGPAAAGHGVAEGDVARQERRPGRRAPAWPRRRRSTARSRGSHAGGGRPRSGRRRRRGPSSPVARASATPWSAARRAAGPGRLAGSTAARSAGRREEMRHPAPRRRQRRAVGRHQAGRQGPRRGHRDPLPQHGPDGQLRAVDGAGRATARHRADEVGEERIPAQRLGHGDRVGVEVQEAAAARHRRPQVARVGQGEGAADGLAVVGQLHDRRPVREPEAAAVDAVDDLLHARARRAARGSAGGPARRTAPGGPAAGRSARPGRPRPGGAPRAAPSAPSRTPRGWSR